MIPSINSSGFGNEGPSNNSSSVHSENQCKFLIFTDKNKNGKIDVTDFDEKYKPFIEYLMKHNLIGQDIDKLDSAFEAFIEESSSQTLNNVGKLPSSSKKISDATTEITQGKTDLTQSKTDLTQAIENLDKVVSKFLSEGNINAVKDIINKLKQSKNPGNTKLIQKYEQQLLDNK